MQVLWAALKNLVPWTQWITPSLPKGKPTAGTHIFLFCTEQVWGSVASTTPPYHLFLLRHLECARPVRSPRLVSCMLIFRAAQRRWSAGHMNQISPFSGSIVWIMSFVNVLCAEQVGRYVASTCISCHLYSHSWYYSGPVRSPRMARHNEPSRVSPYRSQYTRCMNQYPFPGRSKELKCLLLTMWCCARGRNTGKMVSRIFLQASVTLLLHLSRLQEPFT